MDKLLVEHVERAIAKEMNIDYDMASAPDREKFWLDPVRRYAKAAIKAVKSYKDSEHDDSNRNTY